MKKMNAKIRIAVLLLVSMIAVPLQAQERRNPYGSGPFILNLVIEGRIRHMGFVIQQMESVDERFKDKGCTDDEMRNLQHAHHLVMIQKLNELSEYLEEDAESPSPKYTDLRETVFSILDTDAGFDAENGYAGLGEDQKDRQYWEERVAFDVGILKQHFGPQTNEVPAAESEEIKAPVSAPDDDAISSEPSPKGNPAESSVVTKNTKPLAIASPEEPDAHTSRPAVLLMVLGLGGLAVLGLRMAFKKR